MRGRLIVVEGLDGVGKTSLSRALAQALGAAWRTTPGETLRPHRGPFDQAYRTIPAASQLFYAASVLAAAEEARTLLQGGQDLVLDRYWASTCAYARAAGSVLELDEVAALLPRADLTLLLTLPEADRTARLRARGATEADVATLDPARRTALEHALRQALSRPQAGPVHTVNLAGCDPAGALALALRAVLSSAPRPHDTQVEAIVRVDDAALPHAISTHYPTRRRRQPPSGAVPICRRL